MLALNENNIVPIIKLKIRIIESTLLPSVNERFPPTV